MRDIEVDYEELLPFTVTVDLGGYGVKVLRLGKMIELKEGSTREKDRMALAIMKATLEHSGENG